MDDSAILQQILPQAGLSTIFIITSWKLYKDGNTRIQEKDAYIKNLNTILQELYVKNLDLHTKNMEILTKLNDNIGANTKSIDANTLAVRSLEKHV